LADTKVCPEVAEKLRYGDCDCHFCYLCYNKHNVKVIRVVLVRMY
jgi:hypothetical protein